MGLADDAATLVYRASAQRGDVGFEAWMSSTYVRRDGEWKLAVYQQTQIS